MNRLGQRVQQIIVADDEHHIRTVVATKLRGEGYEVREASDGEEALEMAMELPPDAVVTDLQMPVMSGLDLCLALKAEPATAHVPAILLTARGYVLDQDQIARTNIKALMSKPFSAREVVARLADLLRASEADGRDQQRSEAA